VFICICNPQRCIFNYSLIYSFLLGSCNLNPAADLKKIISSVPNLRSRCLMIDVQFSHPCWSVCINFSLQNFPNVALFLVKFASIVSHTCTCAHASIDTHARTHTYIGPILKAMLLNVSVFIIYICYTTSKVVKLFHCICVTVNLSHACHEGTGGKKRYSSTQSYSRHWT